MMGQQPRRESLFYYFRLEDQIPEDHLLKRLDRCIDFRFVREPLRDTYSSIGRPSIDPEVLLRLLLLGYLYGITSERRLMKEMRMHLAYRRPGMESRGIETSGILRRNGASALRFHLTALKP
jgi:transposase